MASPLLAGFGSWSSLTTILLAHSDINNSIIIVLRIEHKSQFKTTMRGKEEEDRITRKCSMTSVGYAGTQGNEDRKGRGNRDS